MSDSLQQALSILVVEDDPGDFGLIRVNLRLATLCIRQIPQHASTPILAMTADAYVGTREKCLQSEMADIICKPLDPQQLQAKVRQWLGKAHA